MAGHSARHFMVLPDHPGAAVVAGHLPSGSTPILAHPSGRPFIIGAIPADQITIGRNGEDHLVVIGRCPVTPERLSAEVTRLRDTRRPDGPADALPGNYHLIASIGGETWVRGSACGLRRVFRARIDGVDLAADRSDVLAALLGARLAPGVVALRMLDVVPDPVADLSVWEGVEAIAPGNRLIFPPASDAAHIRRWWHPPQAGLGLDEGAHVLRLALTTAVEARTSGGGTVTADLSGGLDSTSLCYLAAGGPARVVAYTMASDDEADDDLRYARVAARGLPSVTHHVYPSSDLPDFYGAPDDRAALPDEPSLAMLSQTRAGSRLHRTRDDAARVHIDGLGGDQVLTGTFAFYHDLLRRRPLVALPRLHRHLHLDGMPPRQALRMLADRSSYRDWYTGLLTREGASRFPVFDWEPSPSLPSWITPKARRLIAEQFERAEEGAEPLAARRGPHADLAAIRGAGREIRLLQQCTSADGPPVESPFLDGQVIEACLRVRPEERLTPHEFKPLIKRAMADLLPAELLARRSKADGTTLAAEGFSRHRRTLADLWKTSRLADMGLIDPEPLRRLTTLTYTGHSHNWSMDTTLAVEWWLRSVSE